MMMMMMMMMVVVVVNRICSFCQYNEYRLPMLDVGLIFETRLLLQHILYFIGGVLPVLASGHCRYKNVVG